MIKVIKYLYILMYIIVFPVLSIPSNHKISLVEHLFIYLLSFI